MRKLLALGLLALALAGCQTDSILFRPIDLDKGGSSSFYATHGRCTDTDVLGQTTATFQMYFPHCAGM